MQGLACFEQMDQEEKFQAGFVKTLSEIVDQLPHLFRTGYVATDRQGVLHGNKVQYARLVTRRCSLHVYAAVDRPGLLQGFQRLTGSEMIRQCGNAPQQILDGFGGEIR